MPCVFTVLLECLLIYRPTTFLIKTRVCKGEFFMLKMIFQLPVNYNRKGVGSNPLLKPVRLICILEPAQF